MGDQPESSSQALERYLSTQLAFLSLTVPSDDVEYMSRFVEEDGLERSEKVEGVRGMLEGVVEGGELPEAELDEALGKVVDEWDRLQAEEEERRAQEAAERSPTPPDPKTILSTLTPEEIETARRQAILRQYAYVEGGPEDEAATRDKNAPPKADTAKTAAEKKAAEERRSMIEAALKLDGKKKKYKKQQDVDLLAPNLNKDKMIYMAQMEREAAKKGAQAKKERDKLALDKQKADIAKAKADKQKKAAKQERRA